MTEEFQQLKATIQTTIHTIRELTESNLIRFGDLDRICKVIHNITEYLYNKYEEYEPIGQEVNQMIKTFIDPKVKQAGNVEGRREGILELLQDLGSVSGNLKDEIKSETDAETLKKWLKLAARAKSSKEFAAKMNQ